MAKYIYGCLKVGVRDLVKSVASSESFEELSSSEWFYRNRDIAGFTNPARALYSTAREFVENSLDACEVAQIPLKLVLSITRVEEKPANESREETLQVHIEDNASGIARDNMANAFGRVLVSTKYRLRQQRGMFGLGGKMALLFSQSMTHHHFTVKSSIGGRHPIIEYDMMIDIEKNEPKILKRRRHPNNNRWHGTIIDLTTRGDWGHAKAKIMEYLSKTAIASPYAEITFTDPDGTTTKLEPATQEMPPPPIVSKPHPVGLDLEALRRLTTSTKTTRLDAFMCSHFQRVGPVTAKRVLQFANINPRKDPSKMSTEELLQLSKAMNSYDGFKAPDASCLSPIGKKQLEAGIKKHLDPDFVSVVSRRPSSYSGFPFIVEVAIAYGGGISPANSDKMPIMRFANKIPLLFDEGGDVAREAVDEVNWRLYHVQPAMQILVITSMVSTRIPWRSAGKEMVADRPEILKELVNALRECARNLGLFLSKREKIAHEQKRLGIFENYLPRLARFSTDLAGKEKQPDIKPLLHQAVKYINLGGGGEDVKHPGTDPEKSHPVPGDGKHDEPEQEKSPPAQKESKPHHSGGVVKDLERRSE